MVEDARDEVPGHLRQTADALRIGHEVPLTLPQAQVQMAAAPRAIGEELRQEGCPQAMPLCGRVYRLAKGDLAIGGCEGSGMPDGDLLLPGARFRIVQLDWYALLHEQIDNVITGKHEVVYTFGWYLRKMIVDTRAKGATPILMSLTRTNTWKDGRIDCPSDTYRLWDWQVARNQRVPFVDLSRIIADRYQREGAAAVTAQFINDTVHTNVDGAEKNAADAVAGLKVPRELPLRKYLSARGRAVPPDRGWRADSACPALPSR